MANRIVGKVVGGQDKVFNGLSRVQDVYNALELTGSYSVSVNGEAADMTDYLDDNSFVDFAEKVKGGL